MPCTKQKKTGETKLETIRSKYMKKFLTLFVALLMFAGVALAEDYSRVRAKHILVDTKAEATKIKAAIDDGANFDYYARTYSKCPSGRNNGELGYFGRGQMVKPFEDAAFNGEVGKVSDPVKTQFGWHLIMVEDKVR